MRHRKDIRADIYQLLLDKFDIQISAKEHTEIRRELKKLLVELANNKPYQPPKKVKGITPKPKNNPTKNGVVETIGKTRTIRY